MITLLNEYYRIDNIEADDNDTLFGIALLPGYGAYAGHFPGNPVSPGVCNIQMIKECAERLAGKRLFLAAITRCRFSAVLTPPVSAPSSPQTSSSLRLRMRLLEAEGRYKTVATLYDDMVTYMEFKGELIEFKEELTTAQ